MNCSTDQAHYDPSIDRARNAVNRRGAGQNEEPSRSAATFPKLEAKTRQGYMLIRKLVIKSDMGRFIKQEGQLLQDVSTTTTAQIVVCPSILTVPCFVCNKASTFHS